MPKFENDAESENQSNISGILAVSLILYIIPSIILLKMLSLKKIAIF